MSAVRTAHGFDRWISPEEVADMLCLSVKSVNRRFEEYGIRYYRVGRNGTKRYKVADVLAHIDENTWP